MSIRKVQCVIYRYDPEMKILVLHYSPPRSYWENLTGKVEDGENDFECITREMLEECSIPSSKIEDIVKIHKFQFSTGKESVEENIYAVRVASDTKVDISCNPEMEHDIYRWVTPARAMDMLNWDEMKMAVKLLLELRGEPLISS